MVDFDVDKVESFNKIIDSEYYDYEFLNGNKDFIGNSIRSFFINVIFQGGFVYILFFVLELLMQVDQVVWQRFYSSKIFILWYGDCCLRIYIRLIGKIRIKSRVERNA